MVVRRCRDLDLAGARGVAIGFDHPSRAPDTPIEERLLLRLGESPPLPEERPDRLFLAVYRIHPRQVKPRLKIADLIRGERTFAGRAGSPLRRGGACPELAVARVGLEHPLRVDAEEIPRQETLLFRSQRLRGLSREIEK